MPTNFELVREFHEKFHVAIEAEPTFPSQAIRDLRFELIQEELGELEVADGNDDLIEVADALTDLLYVIYGMGHAYGINLDDCFREVHASNMSKLGHDGKPILRADGKIMKGPNFRLPDLQRVLFHPIPPYVDRDENGQMFLVDPVGFAVATTVAKHNCKKTLELNAERAEHFRQRAIDLGKSNEEVVVLIANADDKYGADILRLAMPGYDFQAIRDRGEVPFGRGLCSREGVQDFLELMDDAAFQKLSKFDGLAVVVVDHGVADVF
jgi:predicted HAD superfamily Cof-like phosphohydrolase